jgi:membrane protein
VTAAPWWRVALAVRRRVRHLGLGDIAASVSFWAFLSLFPALLAVAALLGEMEVLLGRSLAEQIRTNIHDAITRNFSGGTTSGFGKVLLDVTEHGRGSLALAALAGALWSTSKGFAGLCRALALIDGNPSRRRGVRGRLVGLALGAITVVVAQAVLLQLALGPLFGFEKHLPSAGMRVLLDGWDVVRWPLMLVLLVGWTSVLLKLGPGREESWRATLPGAVVTTVVWAVASGGFALAIRFGLLKANPLLGVLGGLVLFLTWLHVMSMAILVGGAVNAEVRPSPTAADAPMSPTATATSAAEPG